MAKWVSRPGGRMSRTEACLFFSLWVGAGWAVVVYGARPLYS